MIPLLTVFTDVYYSLSTLHCVLVSNLVSAAAGIEILRLDRDNPTISVVLETLKIALVADCIFVVTVQLRRRSGTDPTLDFLLAKGPMVIGSSTEIALATSLLQNGDISSSGTFLVGSIYAKLLVLGASCVALSGTLAGRSTTRSRHAAQVTSAWRLALSGGLVCITVPSISSRFLSTVQLYVADQLILQYYQSIS
jgi:hypothetical protein